jgi:omega-6 fatty acid desaturase (delta-12 desaturase)
MNKHTAALPQHFDTAQPTIIGTPCPPDKPMPERKAIRKWLIPLSHRQYIKPILLQIFDSALFLAAIAGIVFSESRWLKILLGCVAGFIIGRLFILGHDACHQSYTPNRTLNRWLGRIAFLPSLTPYSLWEVGHNVVHHGYTNLKGFDFVWAPKSTEEFAALSATDKLLERIYRSGYAPGLYYFIEMWWKRMYFPSSKYITTRRTVFLLDGLLASAFGLFWIGALMYVANITGQSSLTLVLTGFLVPFAFWNSMIGFVVYVHHTHKLVKWYDNKTEWNECKAFVSTTVHLTFPGKIGQILHNIMEHTAHHVDMSIPLYSLKEAQSMLEHLLPKRIVIQHFSLKWYFETARACKLYDFNTKQWLPFSS